MAAIRRERTQKPPPIALVMDPSKHSAPPEEASPEDWIAANLHSHHCPPVTVLDHGSPPLRGDSAGWGKVPAARPSSVNHLESDGNNIEAMIETTEIVRIRREHPRTSIPRSDSYRSVDHVSGHCHPAELPCGPGLTVVK